ncbi:MAG: hypothetical protein IJB34_04255 [Clostridia bacterium]|nr:hypothetical protein [Clostridia bacterium]
MWAFKGYYTGEAKEFIQNRKKKEAKAWSLVYSLIMVFTVAILAVVFNIEDTVTDTVLSVSGGALGIALINLILFISCRRAPKNEIEITNDGIQYMEEGFTRSLALYKIEPIEYHEGFIVVCEKIVLQKELLVEGDWEELKSLLKKVEESLETDAPMYQIEESETQFFEATVQEKRIYEKFEQGVSRVTPIGVFHFFATFQLENGETVEYELERESYEKITEGQTGTLVLVNGNFFDFGDGEEIE